MIQRVWGYTRDQFMIGTGFRTESPEYRMLRVHMNRMRQALGPSGALIRTHLAFGYSVTDHAVDASTMPPRRVPRTYTRRWSIVEDALRAAGEWMMLTELTGICQRAHPDEDEHSCVSFAGYAVWMLLRRGAPVEVQRNRRGRVSAARWIGAP